VLLLHLMVGDCSGCGSAFDAAVFAEWVLGKEGRSALTPCRGAIEGVDLLIVAGAALLSMPDLLLCLVLELVDGRGCVQVCGLVEGDTLRHRHAPRSICPI
jgi:hypothetical protein